MKKTVIILTVVFILILPTVLTPFYSNLWYLATCNGYFTPEESGIFCFEVTKWNEGSGEWWLYGEDTKYWYRLNTGPDYPPKYFILKKERNPETLINQGNRPVIQTSVSIGNIKQKQND